MKKERKVMKKRMISLLGVILIVAALISGCSSNSNSNKSSESKKKIVIRCGVKNSHVPFSQTDDKGNLVGLEEDTVREAFKRMKGYEVKFVPFDASPTLLASLEAGTIDVASGQYVASDKRKETYIIPKNYYTLSPMYLVSRKEDNYQSLKDIAGQSLDFISTSYELDLIKKWNKDNPKYTINTRIISNNQTAADSINQLATKQKNVLLMYKSSYDDLQKKLHLNNLVISDKPVIVEDVYQLFKKSENKKVVDAFDKELKEMKDDGILGKITKKWCGEDYISKYEKLITK